MNQDVLVQLEALAPTFSKGQRRIAAYIAESYDKAAFMTASKLGKTVGVSESTVVRFAVELGYDGYPSMQKALQEVVLNRLTSVQRIGIMNDRFSGQDVVSLVLASDAEKLRQTGEALDREAFQASVNAILNARRIYIIGARSAAILVNFLGHYLNYMFDNVQVVTTSGAGEMFEKLVNVGDGDVVIGCSFPRYCATTAKCAQFCRSVGATVIGLTNSRMSPLGENCDYVLLAKSDMVSLVDSLVAPMSIVNALIVALASAREKELQRTFHTLEHVWAEYNIYEKQDGGL